MDKDLKRTLICGGTLVLPEGERQADLLMEDGCIAAIGESLPADGAEVIDASGCIVLPGAIDTHTHFDLPVAGTVTADDFDNGTRAAILGGTTMVLDFATQDRGSTLRKAFDTWMGRMEGKAHCDVGFHMAITDWNDETQREIAEMGKLGVTSYKMYLAYPALMLEDDAVYNALRAIRKVGGIAGFHCENGRLVGALTQEQLTKGNVGPEGHAASRPPLVEAEAVARLLHIAQLADAPVNIVHLSSKAGLEAVEKNRAKGQQVFLETCPQYLLLEDSVYAREDGAKYICSPPIRGQESIDALWAAVAEDRIYTIGTDHCSFDYRRQKLAHRENFTQVPNGLPGVEHRLALMMAYGVGERRITLTQLAQLLSENPARLFGLYPRKGVLREGSDADVVIWDPAYAHTIRAEKQSQKVDYTPYEGMKIPGGVRDVWLRGGHVVAEHRIIWSKRGKYIERKPSF